MKRVSTEKFLAKKYEELDFVGVWGKSFGTPEVRSSMLVYGEAKNGKTEFCVQLASYLGVLGKVLYVSKEQGLSRSLQQCWYRNKPRKSVVLGVDYTLIDILKELKKRYKAVILDSVDYLKLTEEDVKKIYKAQKKTMIIFVAWGKGKKQKTGIGEKLEFMVDIVVRVEGFLARTKSRFGGGEDYVIWEEGAKKRHAHLNIDNL